MPHGICYGYPTIRDFPNKAMNRLSKFLKEDMPTERFPHKNMKEGKKYWKKNNRIKQSVKDVGMN
ncbi:hypothetical protein Musp01_28440 [Muricauda sp. NBRC 101325]|nr:hypothetical protein Musp01_28440 [Muricauda sp. NBRC 101325]